jgi:hypothetical protein
MKENNYYGEEGKKEIFDLSTREHEQMSNNKWNIAEDISYALTSCIVLVQGDKLIKQKQIHINENK